MTNKQIRWEYLLENPEDELEEVLSGEIWSKVRKAWGYKNPPHGSEVVHHIYRGTVGKKHDINSLLITVSPAAHEYCHKCPKHGVIACLWKKIKKREYDFKEVKEATGRNVTALVQSWVENGDVTNPYYVDLANDLLRIAKWRQLK